MKRIIGLLLLLALLGVAYYIYGQYNKEHTDVATTEAAESIDATDIFAEFDGNEEMAMEQYSDKVIQVSGMVLSSDMSNENEPQLVLDGNGDNGFIRCGFKPSELEKIKAVVDSSKITLKGECKGFNNGDGLDLLAEKDVVLSNCIIIE